MSDIELPLGGVEAEVTSAALAHYAGFLAECAAIGGDAAAVDEAIRPIVTRLSLRLADLMYPDDRLGNYPADIGYHDYQATR